MKKFIALLIFLVGGFEPIWAVHTSVEIINGVPVICKNGEPYNISGWIAAWNPDSVEEVEFLMDFAKCQGFEVVEIFIPWYMIEEEHDSYEWARFDSLMDYAHNIGLYVLIQMTANFANPWFADWLYPDAVFYTYDPDSAQHQDQIWGRVAAFGVGSLPIFYHPDYFSEVDQFITVLVERYRDHPALFGWTLGLWYTGEFNYPGGSYYDIAGFADYSPYTESLYGSKPPHPLNMFSQPLPDTRPEWIAWNRFRIEKKREVLDRYAPMIKSLDPDHILIGYPGGGFIHEMDNGYLTETGGTADYFYMIKNPHVDVIRGAPGVSRNFFEVVDGETSFIHYAIMALVENGYGCDKPFILQCERELNSSAPSVDGKITIWAEFMKSLGIDMLWWQLEEPDSCSGVWTESEKDEIGDTRNISNLPQIAGLTKSDFAFIDLPFESGKYYAEENFTLLFAMKQVKAFMDAGFLFDCLSEDEILLNPEVLNNYKAIGFVHPDMYNLLAPDSLKQIISAFQNSGGIIWNGSPVDGYNYWLSGYTDKAYLNSLRTFYDTHKLVRHHYDSYFIYIVGNKPYIFMLSRESNYVGTIQVNIKGWNLPDGDTTFVEYNSGTSCPATISEDMAILNVNLARQEPYLFVLKFFTGIEEQNGGHLPASFSLFQNYPNPFNSQTTISYQLPTKVNVSLKIYDVIGQEVRTLVNENQAAGNHAAIWDGKNELGESVSSGIYFYQLKLDNISAQAKKLVLLK